VIAVLERWVAFWDRREAPASLALVRILVGAVLLTDLLQAKYAGAVELLWSAPPLGMAWGATGERLPLAARWLGATPQTAELLWGVAVVCAALFLCGAFYRVTAVLLALALGQIGRFEPDADAIDQLFRIAVPLLALSGANAAFSLDAWLRKSLAKPYPALVPAWPRYLLILQLLWMYFSAAHNRGDSAWYPSGSFAAVSNVMSDPHFARYAPGTFRSAYRFTQLGTAATMLFEGSAPLMLLWLWLDWPTAASERRERGGKLGHLLRRLRLRWLWLGLGATLHLGIAITMQLGIFPFGMLALYPIFVHPEELLHARESLIKRYCS
jgi:hypothetical protein